MRGLKLSLYGHPRVLRPLRAAVVVQPSGAIEVALVLACAVELAFHAEGPSHPLLEDLRGGQFGRLEVGEGSHRYVPAADV